MVTCLAFSWAWCCLIVSSFLDLNLWESHSAMLGKLSFRGDLFLLLPVTNDAIILGSLQGLGSVYPSQPFVGQTLSIAIAVFLLSSFPSEQSWFYFDFWREGVFRNIPYLLRDQQCLKEMDYPRSSCSLEEKCLCAPNQL